METMINWWSVSPTLKNKDKAFIEKNADKVIWSELNPSNFNKAFVIKYLKKFNLNRLLKYEKFTEEELVNAIYKHLDDEKSMTEYGQHYWYQICHERTLSEKFIRKYADKLNWKELSSSQKLSESLIDDYADKVDWKCISAFQKLSNSIISKYADKVDWTNIVRFQNCKYAFFEKNKKYIFEQWKNKIGVDEETLIAIFNSKKQFRSFLDHFRYAVKAQYCF